MITILNDKKEQAEKGFYVSIEDTKEVLPEWFKKQKEKKLEEKQIEL